MERSDAIEAEVRSWMRRMEGNDAGVYDAVSRQDGTLIIGAAPGQWTTDPEAAARAYAAEVARLPPSTYDVERIHAYQEGTVGWAAADVTWTIQGMAPLSARLTFVYHREDGGWKAPLVQLSFAIPDEKLFA